MNQGLYSLPPQELSRNLEDLLNSEPELAYTNPEPFKSEKIMDSNHYSEEQYHSNHEFNINLSRRHLYKKLKDSPTRFNQARYRSSSNDASNYVKSNLCNELNTLFKKMDLIFFRFGFSTTIS